ncbi:MAG: hypothetical protein Q7T07_09695 [Burkholderiaceae bacterium]|nr:hypothetical protein [Burkholderiaceae bacterium]
MSDATGPETERRTNTELRSIFPAAFEALRPFFEMANRWEGQSHDHLAYQTLKEHFPTLTAQDVFIVVTTTRRLYATGKLPSP